MTKEKINFVQYWALAWYISSQRKESREKLQAQMKDFLFMLRPEVYQAVYPTTAVAPPGEESEEYGIDELDSIEKWLKDSDRMHTIGTEIAFEGKWV